MTERIIIGSPEAPKYVDSEVDQADYHQFLKDAKAAAQAGYPPELYEQQAKSEIVDDQEGKKEK